MELLNRRRSEETEAILKGRFVRQTLSEAGEEVDKAQITLMARRGFNTRNFFTDRKFAVSKNKLTQDHLAKHRFVDMKYRQTKERGRIKKKHHPVHNKIWYGHANNIIKQLHFGFTNAVKEELTIRGEM